MKFKDCIRADGVSFLVGLLIAVSSGCGSAERPTSPTSIAESESPGTPGSSVRSDSPGLQRINATDGNGVDCAPTDDSGLIPLEGKILFRVFGAPREPEKWILLLYTDYHLACSNFQLANCFRARGRRMGVTISGIEPLEICATSFGPATAEMDLPISGDGRYVLHFKYQEAKDAYLLIFKSGRVEIVPLRSTFTEVSDLHG